MRSTTTRLVFGGQKETQPDDGFSAEAEAREAVIRTGMVSLFLRGTLFRQRVGASLMTVFAAFCWRHAEPALLLTWLIAGLAILGWRNRREAAYAAMVGRDTPAILAGFISAMRPIFTLHGAIWGVSLFFSFDNLPLYDQLGCWLVLACVASAPLTTVALVPALSRAYTNTLFSMLIAVLLGMTATKESGSAGPDLLLLGLPFFYWWLLGRFGKGIHHNQREQFGLQYDIALREQEAREAVHIKNRFLAAASHDMRQPVLALSLYAEHLLEHPDMHLQLAPKIAAASQAVRGLFESLFDLANLDGGQVQLRIGQVDIAQLLADVHNQFEPLAAARRISLRWRGAPSLLMTDAVQMRRMIGNLVGNAIKYSEPDRKILLCARRHRGGVRVQVWDQGFGIPEQHLGNIFKEFYRVDRPDQGSIDGAGLGLSIVTRLARMLDTQVQVDSVVGRGTRFTLDLDATSKAANSPAGETRDDFRIVTKDVLAIARVNKCVTVTM